MNSYKYIHNPIISKYINISHQDGRKTLQHYINKLGGSDSSKFSENVHLL